MNEPDSLQQLAQDMYVSAQRRGGADKRTVLNWAARLRRLTQYPQGRTPVMFDGDHVAAYGEAE
jgi:hypothetical protein